MKKLNAVFLLLLPGLCLPCLARAYGAAGTVGAPYLELPMGARGEGMGEAFTGVADDVNSIYYNPAGLTSVDDVQMELMNISGFGGIQYENIGVAVPTDMLGVNLWSTLALSYTLIGIDDTPVTLDNGGTEETTPYSYTAGDSVVSLSYAWQATQLFSVGATFKILSDKVATYQGWGVAGDVGVQTRPDLLAGLSAGAMIENFGTSPEPGSDLPTDLRMGLGYNWLSQAQSDKLLMDADLVMPISPVDEQWGLNLGGEYTHLFGNVSAVLRAGYRLPQTVLGPEAGLSLGGGLGTHISGIDISLDYAWVPYGELGDMQRIALNIGFGTVRQRPGAPGPAGNYLYPPKHVTAEAGRHSAQLNWDPQTGRVDGYNIYMSYDPANRQWTRLNKEPIHGTSMAIRSLYSGYKVYFCVSTLRRKADNLYLESDKSKSVVIIPN
ncbi:MAG: PorV/PorQ family protein [bacterium]